MQVYDQKIGDLLDPTQRDLEVSIDLSFFISCKSFIKLDFVYNLQIKDDVKNGLYVENLTEEYVTCYEEITQILIKVAERGLNLDPLMFSFLLLVSF